AFEQELQRHRKACQDWMDSIHDLGTTNEEEMLLAMWPNKVQPVTDLPLLTESPQGWLISSTTPGASLGYAVLAPNDRIEYLVLNPYQSDYQIVTPSDTLNLSWTIPNGPVSVPVGKKLAVVAHRLGYAPSEFIYID
ncbi:MAG: hypothetical protein NWR72_02120, partial [Bacteroidia bacterium]|nr:hypothetical protein [Bacteroidia bacterium]